MIGKIVRFRAPEKCFRLPFHHQWADNPTWPDCHCKLFFIYYYYFFCRLPGDFRCPTLPTDLAPRNILVALLRVVQSPAALPQFADLPPLQIDFYSFIYLYLFLRLIDFYSFFLYPYSDFYSFIYFLKLHSRRVFLSSSRTLAGPFISPFLPSSHYVILCLVLSNCTQIK